MKQEIKIIALDARDGLAFIEDSKQLFFLRPPYDVAGKTPCHADDIEEAVIKYGFRRADYSFNHYSELIRFIKNEYNQAAADDGVKVPTTEELTALLDSASENVIIRFLQRIDDELIPGGNIDAAESLTRDLMKLEKLRENKVLLDRSLDILFKCMDYRKKKNAWEKKFRVLDFRKKYIYVGKKYPIDRVIEKTRIIQQRGILFPILSH